MLHLRQVPTLLRETGVKYKPNKFSFFAEKIDYLGQVIWSWISDYSTRRRFKLQNWKTLLIKRNFDPSYGYQRVRLLCTELQQSGRTTQQEAPQEWADRTRTVVNNREERSKTAHVPVDKTASVRFSTSRQPFHNWYQSVQNSARMRLHTKTVKRNHATNRTFWKDAGEAHDEARRDRQRCPAVVWVICLLHT